jgi:hypothetical protein
VLDQEVGVLVEHMLDVVQDLEHRSIDSRRVKLVVTAQLQHLVARLFAVAYMLSEVHAVLEDCTRLHISLVLQKGWCRVTDSDGKARSLSIVGGLFLIFLGIGLRSGGVGVVHSML